MNQNLSFDGDNIRHGLNNDLGFDEKVELKILEE